MRIGIVSPSYGYGGANIVSANLGKELLAHHDVYFFPYKFTTNFSEIPDERFFYIGTSQNTFRKVSNKIRKGLEVLFTKEFTPSKYYRNEFQNLCFHVEKKNLEVMILSSFESSVLFAEELKKKYPHLKIISWMHESVSYSFGSLTKNYPTAFRRGLKVSDEIVCLTHEDKETYDSINSKTKVIYNPVFLDYQKTTTLNQKIISFTTRLDIQVKGLDYLVKVAQMLPDDWKVRVAGHGRPEQLEAFKTLLEQEDQKHKIEFVGSLKGEALANHYYQSSLFLSTSRTEGLPLVLIEALFFGLPIVSFNHSGGKEILSNGKYGTLVPIGDTLAMANAITNLIQNKEALLEWQQKSLVRSKDFATEKIIQQWLDLLSGL